MLFFILWFYSRIVCTTLIFFSGFTHLTQPLELFLYRNNFHIEIIKIKWKYVCFACVILLFYLLLLRISNICRISYRWTNNEEHVDVYKYDLYFYSSTVTFVWSRNTVRESSYISFFCGGDPLCELEQRPENTHGAANRFAWVTCRFLCSVQSYRPYIAFQLLCGNIHMPLRPRIFCLWLVTGTYILLFFFR